MKKTLFLSILATASLCAQEAPKKTPVTDFIFQRLENNEKTQWCRSFPGFGKDIFSPLFTLLFFAATFTHPYFKRAILQADIQRELGMEGTYHAEIMDESDNVYPLSGLRLYFSTESKDSSPHVKTDIWVDGEKAIQDFEAKVNLEDKYSECRSYFFHSNAVVPTKMYTCKSTFENHNEFIQAYKKATGSTYALEDYTK
ncbi:MAG: hypothetical protein K2X90_00310 [Candidatus Babeliaceae bacterium]|nr:hypothetical protein [Candidatus Babeliaceae bacterium]